MDNRGEIVDEEDREWVLKNSGSGHAGDLICPMCVDQDLDLSSNDRAYGIREALIARKMGLSEGSEGRKDAE